MGRYFFVLTVICLCAIIYQNVYELPIFRLNQSYVELDQLNILIGGKYYSQ
jgi:hypothetical protein